MMIQSAAQAAAWAVERIGQGYIWGATGWVCSKARREQQARQYPDQAEMILGVGAKWDGKVCWDCATFVRGAAQAGGVTLCSGATSQWRKTAWVAQGPITTLPRDQVVMLYRESGGKMQHTGLYLGDGTCAHAKGTRYGVIRQPVGDYPWTHWARPAWTEEKSGGGDGMAETLVVTSGDGNPVRMRKAPDGNADVLCKIAAGIQVTRSSDDGTWSAIEYGGVHGYMMSKFLTALGPANVTVTRDEFDALKARVSALEAQA